jgi:histone H2B
MDVAPTPFSKGGKVGAKGVIKRKKNKKRPQYSTYTYKVLKQVHKDLGMSKKAMLIFDNFIGDILERLAVESSKLAKRQKKTTLKAREMMTAAKLVLPGELAKHACVQGKKAVEKLAQTKSGAGP